MMRPAAGSTPGCSPDLVVDVLVNNAGVTTMGPVHRSDPAQEVAMIRTNVEAVADLCASFLPGMVDRGTGAVLNVASTAAFQPLPGQAGYSASKAFVLSCTHALRGEQGTGVTATAWRHLGRALDDYIGRQITAAWNLDLIVNFASSKWS